VELMLPSNFIYRAVSRRIEPNKRSYWINWMTEPKDHDAIKIDDKLHKLIKRVKKQKGMLWPSVVSKLELARADIKSMIKVYESGPK
jgi:hypothetical protein